MNEADTCRTLVRPKLEASGWDTPPHSYSEQTSFTDGRIIVPGGKPRRLKKKFSDFFDFFPKLSRENGPWLDPGIAAAETRSPWAGALRGGIDCENSARQTLVAQILFDFAGEAITLDAGGPFSEECSSGPPAGGSFF